MSFTVTVWVALAVLPAASVVVTVSTFVPACSTMPLAVQLVVPVAVPLPPRLFAHVTRATRTSSDAVPLSVNGEVVVVYVAADVGDVIASVGAVVSSVIVTLAVAVLAAASCAVTVTTLAPACSTMPPTVQLVVPLAVPLPPRPASPSTRSSYTPQRVT